ncbi:MAG: NADH-quinone oxidoreductase subunit NuoK [Nitrospirota bacterium]
MIPFSYVLTLSAVLFGLGVVCVAVRKNLIMILIGVEIIANAAGLAFVAGSQRWNMPEGQIFVLFLATMAASEVSVGLAMIVYLHRRKKSVNIDHFDDMKG